MSSKKPDTEILVHITAPSRAADDADYRVLAAAYVSFEPASRTSIAVVGHSARQQDDTGNLALTQQPVISSSTSPAFESPDLSFRDVIHNLGSPGLRHRQPESVARVDESQLSWRPPPSVVADSNPDNNITIARYCSPTRILEHYLQGFDSSQSNTSQPLPSETSVTSPATNRGFTAVPPDGIRPLPPHSPTSGFAPRPAVIPHTPIPASRKRSRPVNAVPGSEGIGASSSLQSQHSDRTGRQDVVVSSANMADVRPLPFLSSASDIVPFLRAGSEPAPPQKRQRRAPASENGTVLLRSTSDIGPRQDGIKEHQLHRRQRARQAADGLEVHSPEPQVGCQDLDVTYVVTEKLEKLARDVDIRKRFRPREMRRVLRPFERGYWHVDCSAWPDSIKRDTWGFLTNYVSNGDAGWGIWCRRDKDYKWIRLYCWGCAIGHMHLLLYLASRRELNYTGTTWVGGDGEAVVVMEPKYAR